MRATVSAVRLGMMLGQFGLCVAVLHSVGGGGAVGAEPGATRADAVAAGYEIFNREWLPDDPRGHGGDGLGPVFNDSSCVACHNSGGSGGAGPVSKNIDILSAARSNMPVAVPTQAASPGQAQCVPGAVDTAAVAALLDVHAGFRNARTVVLHKFGVDPNYDAWRSKALGTSGAPTFTTAITGDVIFVSPPGPFNPTMVPFEPVAMDDATKSPAGPNAGNRRSATDAAEQRAAARLQQVRMAVLASNPGLKQQIAAGPFVVSRSQRNPSPLFGLGLIDAIPDEAIEAMAARQGRESREIQGRVSRLKDGRVGRLGWKAQTANTEDFVLNACAVELGLEVPGHHQAMTPQAPRYQPSGLDLTADECSSLVAYVRSLPRPLERRASGVEETKHLEAGRSTFASIGCSGCHAPKVANVVGIYSDLLLHDMGQDLGDDGSYDGSEDGTDEPLIPRQTAELAAAQPAPTAAAARQPKGANRREWRTPPLWGFRDSGPYLHDGRAQTLEQAVAMHGGQGQASALKYFQLSPRERLQLESFLKSLVAPPAVQLAHRGE